MISQANPRTARLTAIVPTYNERERLPELVEAIFRAYAGSGLDAGLVVVDDNSPDGTGALAEELARRYPIQVVHRAAKLGLGSAVKAGIAATSAEILGVLDADLSHPPALLPRMLAVMERTGADMVIGSRYISGGGTHNWSIGRRVMSRIACLMARPLTPVRDATSGFFLVRRELADRAVISAAGFKIALELLVRGGASTVVEVPYVFEGRSAGRSKMNASEAFGYLAQLLDLRRFTRNHPPPSRRYLRLTAAALERLTQADGADDGGVAEQAENAGRGVSGRR